MEEIFTSIYNEKKWGFADGETLSGGGSTKKINKYRNIFLANFINNYNILYVYDICGDCNWQYDFVKIVQNKKFRYFGIDVSNFALKIAREKNKANIQMSFSKEPIDLCKSVLKCSNKQQSLIILKGVIQHLSFEHAIQMLNNIKKSGIQYIAISNHDEYLFNVTENINIKTGEFYKNNMFLPPFNFTNPLKNVDDLIINNDEKKGMGGLLIFDIQNQNNINYV